jgi:predicted nucleotidyltransferase
MPSTIAQPLAPQGPVVSAILAQLPNAMAIYGFGSQIQGTAGPQSDLDLAVLVAAYADPLVLWDEAGSLAEALKRMVAFRNIAVQDYQALCVSAHQRAGRRWRGVRLVVAGVSE